MCVVSAVGYDCELVFPFRQVLRFQICVGMLERFHPGYSQALHQAVLSGLEAALDSPLGLWGICRDPAYAQLAQCPADLSGWQRLVSRRVILFRRGQEDARLI